VIVFNLISLESGPEPTGGLYAIQPGEAEPRQLTNNPRDYEPSFSPSGMQLVFRRFGPNAEPGLYKLDLRTGRTVQLVGSSSGDQDAAYGRRGMVAFTRFADRSYDVFIRMRDGKVRRLTRTSVATESDPVFTPNGKRIVFTRQVQRIQALGAIGGTVSTPRLYSIRTDGTGLRLLGTVQGASDLDISPNGHRLAFGADGPGPQLFNWAVWTRGLLNGKPHLVTGNAAYPAYSPAGGKIVYSNYQGVWIKRADGRGAPRQILVAEYTPMQSGGELAIQPAWQPLPK
jgi:Tol biopolymer transport system component